MNELEKKKADRFRFLKRLYEVGGGNRFAIFDEKEIGRDVELTPDETDAVTQYLEGENLIAFHGGQAISITHWGVREIEKALSEPDHPTQYFPPVNIINVHSMVNSQIQQATHGSTQTLYLSKLDQDNLKMLLSEIKSTLASLNIGAQRTQDLSAEIRTIEAQLESSNPKRLIIREALQSVRNILEQVGAGVLVAEIAKFLLGLG